MAIAVFKSLEGESLEDVASALFQKWRLGQKGLDNGVLLVVFVQDRKMRVEVGYGLEATLPDAVAGQIIRDAIAPRFREQRYAAGLEAAVTAVYGRLAPTGAPESLQRKAEPRRGLSTREIYLLFFLSVVAITVASLAWNVSHQRGYTASPRGWRSSGPGGWYGGGWGGGGWSGGGGSSDGGFSGGGGSSGGGGASGSW